MQPFGSQPFGATPPQGKVIIPPAGMGSGPTKGSWWPMNSGPMKGSFAQTNSWNGVPTVPTVPCRHFAAGNCQYGALCGYLHEVAADGKPVIQETPLCRNFVTGECKYGENCAFSHDASKVEAEKTKPIMEVSSVLCKSFKNTGFCKYGDWCGFTHQANPHDLPMTAAPPVTPATPAFASSDTAAAPAEANGLQPPQRSVAGPPWLREVENALREALLPHAALDTQDTAEVNARKCATCIAAVAGKFHKDDRRTLTASSLLAQALTGEFVRACMQALAEHCADKAWYASINFAQPLETTSRNIFRGGKVFSRTPATSIRAFVDEALFRYKEEERIEALLRKAVASVGNYVPDPFDQLALGHLLASYDEVHLNAPWGSHGAPSTTEGLPSMELGLVQDFVKGWMVEFLKRAQQDILQSIGDDKVTFVTLVFEFLTHPDTCAVPFDLVSALTIPIPPRWSFIHETAMSVLTGIPPPQPGHRPVSAQSSQSITQAAATAQTAPAQQPSYAQALEAQLQSTQPGGSLPGTVPGTMPGGM
jgi:hypothetical protein